MTLFYDPQKRKPKPWVVVVFVLIPIIVFIICWTVGQALKGRKSSEPAQKADIFKKS